MFVKLIKLITESVHPLCLLLLVFAATGAHASPCAATPEAAVRAWSRQQESQLGTGTLVKAGPGPGYAVERIMVDSTLGSRWAIVMDCLHPERPVLAVALAAQHSSVHSTPVQRTISLPGPPPHSSPILVVPLPTAACVAVTIPPTAPTTPRKMVAPSSAPMLVRAGDSVVLWNREPQLLLEVAAIALEYGHAGQVIRVRRSGQLATPATTLTGIVRAAGSVELIP